MLARRHSLVLHGILPKSHRQSQEDIMVNMVTLGNYMLYGKVCFLMGTFIKYDQKRQNIVEFFKSHSSLISKDCSLVFS